MIVANRTATVRKIECVYVICDMRFTLNEGNKRREMKF